MNDFNFYYKAFYLNNKIFLMTDKGKKEFVYKPFYAELSIDNDIQSEYKTIYNENCNIVNDNNINLNEQQIGYFNLITQFLAVKNFKCKVENIDITFVSIEGRLQKTISFLNNNGFYTFDYNDKEKINAFINKLSIKILIGIEFKIKKLEQDFIFNKNEFLLMNFEILYGYFDNSLADVNFFELAKKYKFKEVKSSNSVCNLLKKINGDFLFFENLLQSACDENCLITEMFRPTVFWRNKIYNHLLSKKILTPIKAENNQYSTMGGFFDSKKGFFKKIKVIDVKACYLSHIEQYNIGIETKVKNCNVEQDKNVLNNMIDNISLDVEILQNDNKITTPSNCSFIKTKKSFLSDIVFELKNQKKNLEKINKQKQSGE